MSLRRAGHAMAAPAPQRPLGRRRGRLDRWDLIGAVICLLGVAVIMYAHAPPAGDAHRPACPLRHVRAGCASSPRTARRSARSGSAARWWGWRCAPAAAWR
ncbi:hypothetical protein [Micromonospora sp. NPDC047074]|uniref:hypothetical protein n=1 Tax=Micromonospora sp. NPDC047074 TaxID=3154339 RepID=UPI0033EA3110